MQGKPIDRYYRHRRYQKHINTLATIEQEKPRLPSTSQELECMHKIRSHSISFHQQEYKQHISHENEMMLNRLLSISKRRQSEYSQSPSSSNRSISTFHNPARKKRQKMITEMNQRMAERLLLKESALSYKKMRRSIENYESIKRTMHNNRKVAHHATINTQTLPGLSVSLKRSKVTDGRKSRARRTFLNESERSATMEVGVGANPEVGVGGCD